MNSRLSSSLAPPVKKVNPTKHLFTGSHRCLSSELPDVLATAVAGPRGFLELNPAPVIFDEIQSAPDLLTYVIE